MKGGNTEVGILCRAAVVGALVASAALMTFGCGNDGELQITPPAEASVVPTRTPVPDAP